MVPMAVSLSSITARISRLSWSRMVAAIKVMSRSVAGRMATGMLAEALLGTSALTGRTNAATGPGHGSPGTPNAKRPAL